MCGCRTGSSMRCTHFLAGDVHRDELRDRPEQMRCSPTHQPSLADEASSANHGRRGERACGNRADTATGATLGPPSDRTESKHVWVALLSPLCGAGPTCVGSIPTSIGGLAACPYQLYVVAHTTERQVRNMWRQLGSMARRFSRVRRADERV